MQNDARVRAFDSLAQANDRNIKAVLHPFIRSADAPSSTSAANESTEVNDRIEQPV